MTTYTAIPNGDVDQDSPVTQPLLTLMRDNPIAITEGAPGAPRNSLPSLERIPVGDTIKIRSDAVNSLGVSASYIAALSVGFLQAGTVRATLEHRAAGAGTSDARIRRTRAGVATTIVTWTTFSGTFQLRTQDVDVQPGDLVTLEHRNGGGAGTAEIQNARIRTAPGVFLWPVTNFGQIEDNPTIT